MGAWGNTFDRAGTLETRAYALFQAKELDEAKRYLHEAVELYETLRAKAAADELAKVSVLDTQTIAYDLWQQIEVELGHPEEALRIAEWSRARALVENLGRGRAPGRADLPSLEHLLDVVERCQATVVEYSVIYDPMRILVHGRFEGEQPTLEERLFIWVVQPGREVFFRSVDLRLRRQSSRPPLSVLIRDFRRRIGRRSGSLQETAEAETSTVLRELHEILVEPVADLLSAHRVVIVPHGPLYLLPFAALRDAAGEALGERFTLLTVPSIKTLASTRERDPSPWRAEEVLVVGNPAVKDEGGTSKNGELKSLPYAGIEAREVARRLGAEALIGENATRDAILERLPGARLVHVACHNLLAHKDARGIPGALKLAPSGADDGLLTAGQLAELEMWADLVILSACDTGRGRITSDGVLNLTRALITAGTAAVVVSLWEVEDLSTALLMDRFYQYRLDGDPPSGESAMPVALALRRSQLWVRRLTVEMLRDDLLRRRNRPAGQRTALDDLAPQILTRFATRDTAERPFAAPYYWAPFVYVGA